MKISTNCVINICGAQVVKKYRYTHGKNSDGTLQLFPPRYDKNPLSIL
jgi:hypothetical protein